MEIFVTFESGMIVFKLVGELDEHAAEKARRFMDDALLTNNYTAIVFDMSRLTFMDSTGIGVVIGRYKLARKQNKRTYVRNTSPTVDKIFKMSGLYEIISKIG